MGLTVPEKGWGCLSHLCLRNKTKSDKAYNDLHDALCNNRVGLNNLANEFCCKDITSMLNAEATEATVSLSNKMESAEVVCSNCEQIEREAGIAYFGK